VESDTILGIGSEQNSFSNLLSHHKPEIVSGSGNKKLMHVEERSCFKSKEYIPTGYL
jgi:hypothetical protein